MFCSSNMSTPSIAHMKSEESYRCQSRHPSQSFQINCEMGQQNDDCLRDESSVRRRRLELKRQLLGQPHKNDCHWRECGTLVQKR